MRSNRTADAEIVFSQLLAEHADSPEVHLLRGRPSPSEATSTLPSRRCSVRSR